jgi:hypothetical protein
MVIACLSGLAAGEDLAPALRISRKITAKLVTPDPQSTPSKQYSQGDPTADEQYMLEITNRARSNPPAECQLLLDGSNNDIVHAIESYQVDLNVMRQEFSTYSGKPPLAFNAQLMQSAQAHSQDMIEHDFQSHTGSDGSTLQMRFQRVGYAFSLGGENIFSYARSVWHAHAAFLIDWGVADLGHRINILELNRTEVFREVGIRILPENDPRTTVGPLVMTEDFGMSNPQVVFITGVVYRDTNKNQFYDQGEGLGGVKVLPDHGEYFAVSTQSGGYAIPVAVDSGAYRLKIIRSDLPEMVAEVTAADQNMKTDFRLGEPTLATINGTIVIDQTGQPLPGVQVKLNPVDRIYLSDSGGGFYYSDLPATSYTISAEFAGYEITPNNFTVTLTGGQNYRVQLIAKPIPTPTASPTPPDATGITDVVPAPAATVCGTPALVLMLGLGLAMITLTGSPDLRPGSPRKR